MKKQMTMVILTLAFSLNGFSQNISAKEKAETLAKSEFSKLKHKRVEKYGVVKEMHKVIESTPAVNNDVSFYLGNYMAQGLGYNLEVSLDTQNQWIVTLINDDTKTVLKNVVIKDAYFTGKMTARGGIEEVWEGVFINKNDGNSTEFGLGVKLPRPMTLNNLNLTRLFFKKVSP